MHNFEFSKAMENVRNHGDIKLMTFAKRRNKLASEPNYHCYKTLLRKITHNGNE